MNEEKKQGIKQAIALRYQVDKDAAPKVVGTGKGLLAEDIISLAKQHNIPIQEDPSLVAMLSQLQVNQSIPPELYEVVAEVFAFIYRIDQNGEKAN
ncbi:EscU/YscU/HrcU family type III secretion system export apparatus switch protein [Halalkalibacter akibai]|uniref:Flagellar biosynthesis protein FlhB n=1 Tax=Halalkalibacter akibai (strain ATCC 43226 / DSM 21942 / CIP 109018 / JCM 9157 / 1139) TaxID=1236973 RepID=W4QPF3_HALA3|nr:EscU/YscU/HrcU family type III secretion system export apparatus switch protein [Halalkalibacter akibai]GAE33936.1 flagellar biosynthesis protein FlhB [Halalkalibacter akibai JCM 9157]